MTVEAWCPARDAWYGSCVGLAWANLGLARVASRTHWGWPNRIQQLLWISTAHIGSELGIHRSGTHCLRDALSWGCIVQGIYAPREIRTGTVHTGAHRTTSILWPEQTTNLRIQHSSFYTDSSKQHRNRNSTEKHLLIDGFSRITK